MDSIAKTQSYVAIDITKIKEDLLKNIRAMPEYETLPIVMITTRGMKDDVMKAMKLVVNGFVIKPFTLEVLRTKLEAILK